MIVASTKLIMYLVVLGGQTELAENVFQPRKDSKDFAVALLPPAVLSGSGNLETGRAVSTFTADQPLYCCAVAADSRTIVAGDASGKVHFPASNSPGDNGA